MYERVLQEMRERIRTRQYVMTLHAEEEMDDDGLTIYDVERGILTSRVVERQKDQERGEWKYVLSGQSVRGSRVGVVVKLGLTGKLVIITVWQE